MSVEWIVKSQTCGQIIYNYNLSNSFFAKTIPKSCFSGVYIHGSSVLHTLQNKNGMQTLPQVAHRASGSHHAWNSFGMVKKLLITLRKKTNPKHNFKF